MAREYTVKRVPQNAKSQIDYAAELNERQFAAVTAPPGPSLVIAGAGVRTIRRADTTLNPLKPETSSALVTSGIYRYTRNPMYLGMATWLLAWSAWLGTPIGLLGAPLFMLYMNQFQIGPEERALRTLFGAEFEAYAARVRRWF